MRYFFEIAYKGTDYHGWQNQNNAISVQQTVEEALYTFTRQKISITGSGRTDTGVHCSQQYFHADVEGKANSERLQFKLNSLLPSDISIQSVQAVKPEAHARFDATERAYEYRIIRKKSPFLKDLTYLYAKPLNIQTMNEAAALLVGKQDFEAFSKVKTEVNNFVCEINQAEWIDHGNDLIFHISANRFLRGMVRAIVGTLLMVGEGKLTIDDVKKILSSKNRKEAGRSAPACGLFLTRVTYPQEIFI